MNTLEELINKELEKDYMLNGFEWRKIEDWTWVGDEYELAKFRNKLWWEKNYVGLDNRLYDIIGEIVRQASNAVCLTSPSHWIRSCKTWYNSKEGKVNE